MLVCLLLAPGCLSNRTYADSSNSVDEIQQKGKTVTITVKDDLGPAVGATVTLKGSKTIGGVTNADGQVTLNGLSANSVLTISYIGFETKEITVGNRSSITVNLEESKTNLDEVVVTALGMTREKKALGYAMTELKGDDIAKANSANPILGMQGKVAGVQINMGSTGPQSSNRIIIRGNTSLGSNNQPIFVVDGVIIDNEVVNTGQGQDFGNELKEINNDDIETMSVLKGAAATALYGSRAANGVILIKTKRGRRSEGIGISVSHTQQWETVYDFMDLQNRFGTGTYPGWDIDSDGNEVRDLSVDRSFGPEFDDQEVTIGGHSQLYSARPDNWKVFYQTGNYSNTNIALHGGDEKSSFRLSYSNLMSNGVTYNNNYDRNSFNLTAERQISKFLKVEAGFAYMHSKTTNPQWTNANNPLYTMMYIVPREYDSDYWIQHYKSEISGGYNGSDPYGQSRYIYANREWRSTQREDNYRAFATMTLNVTDWLQLVVKGDLYKLYTNYENKVPSNSADSYTGASYTLNDNHKDQYTITGMAMANHTWGDFSAAGAIAVEQWDTRRSYHNTSSSGGLLVPELFDMTNSVNEPETSVRKDTDRKRINSIYAYANLSYKDTYFLDLTARNDWSSALIYSDGHGHTSYFYPSIGGSWLFTNTFRKQLPEWISFGKLRASYAIVGKDCDPYVTTGTGYYVFSDTFISTTDNASYPYYSFDSSSMVNLNLKPEKQHAIELGMEMRFFQNRLGFDFAYYKTNTKNQILSLPVATGSGMSSRLINAGNIQNKGIELLVTGTPIQTKDWNWDLSWNMTINRNKIISLAEGVEKYRLTASSDIDTQAWATVGGSYGDIYTSYAYERDENGNKLLDSSGHYIRSGVSTKIGSIEPKFLWGATSTLRYKDFTLEFVLDARVGGDIVSANHNYGSDMGNLKSTLYGRTQDLGGLARTTSDGRTFYDGIIPEGVFRSGTTINGTDVSGWTYQQAYDQGLVQPVSAYSYYSGLHSWGTGIREDEAQKCSWISLRQIALTWNCPKSWARKVYAQNINVSFIMRNVCYLYNSLDDNEYPEALKSNYSAEYCIGGAPYSRNYAFTVQFEF